MLDEVIDTARLIRDQRYPQTAAAYASGSYIRGEATPYSDIDLVVVYASLPNAYRESFTFNNFPVEAFVHDPETLRYFILEVDRPSGTPMLAQMIVEGIEIPGPNALSRSLKEFAAADIAAGPPPLSPDDRRGYRYAITDLIDDLRQPRSEAELMATGTRLYGSLANYYLRMNDFWSAAGKSIPRVLRRANEELSARFISSFQALFQKGEIGSVLTLAAEILEPDGGFLFDGYRLDAPPGWRKS